MKKLLVSVCILACMSMGAFAEFIWDPIVFGYQNVSFKSTSTYEAPRVMGFTPTVSVTTKTKANNFAIGAGIGYLPKDKGFCFMWESTAGFGKAKTKIASMSINGVSGGTSFLEKLECKGMSITFMSDLIFGFAFSPIENMKLSFGTGLSVGANGLAPGSDETVRAVYLGASIGLPLDATMRYYFGNNVGVVVGLKDVIGYSVGEMGVVDHNNSEIIKGGGAGGLINTVNIKVGLTTKW